MSDYYLEQLAEMRAEIAALKRERVTYRTAEVVATGDGSFAADVAGAGQLSGIAAPTQFMPAVGERVRLTLNGAVPQYEPAGIAENAVTGREIAPGAVDVDQLAFELSDYTGGTTIFYGPDTPTATGVGDLWLKAPENVAYRWNGTTWAEVRDQGVVAALQEAQAAQQAADQAAGDAFAALGAAGTAQDAAEAAANVAAGKTTTFRQDAQPPTTGRTVGDQWYETDQGNRLHVWGANNAWNLAPLGAAGIGATARQLGAITTYKQATAPTSGMVVGDFWIRSTDNRIHRYEGTSPAWVESKDAEINTAISNAATAQATADGKVRIFTQATAPTGMVAGDVGDLWVDTDDGNRLYTWSGTQWVSRQLGNSAIQPNSLIASNVIATGTVTAALLEALMVLANVVIAGDPNGVRAVMDGVQGGFRTYAKDPATGQVYESSSLGGPGEDIVAVRDTSGRVKGGIDNGGMVTGTGANIAGDPVLGGYRLSEHLATRSSGAEIYGRGNGPTARSTGPELGFYEVVVPLLNGRMYTLNTSQMRMNGSVDGQVGCVNVRYTTRPGFDPTATPSLTSPMLTRSFCQLPYGVGGAVPAIRKVFAPPNEPGVTTYRFLLTHHKVAGAGDVYIDYNDADAIDMWVEDLGPVLASSATANNGGGGSGGEPVPAPKLRVDETFSATWSRTWRGNGTVFTDEDAYQGSIGDSNGNMYSLIGFPDIVQQRLAGASIEAIQVYLFAEHWYSYAGGYAYIGSHGHGGPPAAVSLAQYGNIAGAEQFPRGGAKWINIPSAHFASWANGTFKGVTLGPAPNASDRNYYGRFAGGSASLIRLVYTK